MDKNEILLKSRKENKNKDLYAIEVQSRAIGVSAFTALILATAFFVIQAVVGSGFNYGLYAIVFSTGAANFIYNAIIMKRKRDIVFGVIYAIATLLLSIVHIYQLVS